MIAITVAHRYCDIVKLFVKNYNTNINSVEYYSLYTALRQQQSWQYLLNLKADINYIRENKTFLINIIQFASYLLSEIEKLTSTTSIDINKRDNVNKSPLVAATQNRNGDAATILLNYRADIHKSFSLSDAI